MTFLKNPDDMITISNSDDIARLRKMSVACSKLSFNNVTNVPGIPRTTHSPDSFAVGVCMRNSSVIYREKLLPPSALYAVHFISESEYIV
jgi:hypothetical protein